MSIEDDSLINHYNEVKCSLSIINNYMELSLTLLVCNLCESTIATKMLQINEHMHLYICEKCADGVKNYKARFCGKCYYPNIKQDYEKTRLVLLEEVNHNNEIFEMYYTVNKPLLDLSKCEISCDICTKYKYRSMLQSQTDFFKIDFYCD